MSESKTEIIRMTAAERTELVKLVRLRSRVAKKDVDSRISLLLAQFESQIAAVYDRYDENWKELTLEAEQKLRKINAEIQVRCEKLGIPKRFRPELQVEWYGRGENARKERRAELRRVAETKLAAQANHAKVEIEHNELELTTKIVQEGLDSEHAKAFLAALPTVAELMPPVSLPEVEKKVESDHEKRFGNLLE